jgi:hypothetical protein
MARAFGAAHLATALLVGWGVFRCLPARWLPVDAVAGVITLLDAVAGVGLAGQLAWGRTVARAASIVSLAAGLVLVTLLAVTASWLGGVYGPVGGGGAAIVVLVAALAAPYLIVLPCAELAWLGLRERARGR